MIPSASKNPTAARAKPRKASRTGLGCGGAVGALSRSNQFPIRYQSGNTKIVQNAISIACPLWVTNEATIPPTNMAGRLKIIAILNTVLVGG